ncbi:hypothetical protein ACO22_06305 [Paracoccidioides brasiliensis]|uniref:Uncharacterized protein n=1 Tax=Paracoccidioides brasiliensis TaxID=121759 RepID=A0A1D2J800_PARBR|nr:hypothetical protein ACO22_06305 [Paracoccidioides brasiliensis]
MVHLAGLAERKNRALVALADICVHDTGLTAPLSTSTATASDNFHTAQRSERADKLEEID